MKMCIPLVPGRQRGWRSPCSGVWLGRALLLHLPQVLGAPLLLLERVQQGSVPLLDMQKHLVVLLLNGPQLRVVHAPDGVQLLRLLPLRLSHQLLDQLGRKHEVCQLDSMAEVNRGH